MEQFSVGTFKLWINQFNPTHLLGLRRLILPDREEERAQPSAAPEKKPAGVQASWDEVGANTWEQALAVCPGHLLAA